MFLKKIVYRIYQKIMYLAAFFIDFSEPEIFEGQYSLLKISYILKKEEIDSTFIVSDKFLSSTIVFQSITKHLKENNIKFTVYNKTEPNPSIDQIEEAFVLYKDSSSKAIIAFGGGSPMDLAKAVGARVAKPNKTIPQLRGTLKVRRKLPLLIAIPTTVGTGSETTLAAVVSNRVTHEKYSIMDSVLIPKYAILDVDSVKDLPSNLIATTGLDALTHAIESFTNNSNTKKTNKMAMEAVRLIFENILNAYNHDKIALANMQKAAYMAGVAFTRGYVGNVHAIAHTLGGFYQVPHGLANAVILPYILKFYGKSIHKKLALLARVANVGNHLENDSLKANALIDEIVNIRKMMCIQDSFNGIIKDTDIDKMIDRAYKEANPLYPVPYIMSKKEFREIYNLINK